MSKLSDLNVQALEPERLADLRSRAVRLLAGPNANSTAKGTAQGTAQSTAPDRATEALTVLHALASSQQTAPDALTLLHELQVYQVELELQAQELRESRAELESALHRQLELHDHQPVGCFSVDARLVLREVNQTGADLLGVSRLDAGGLPLDAFFNADSARRFQAAVAQVADSWTRAACPVRLLPRHGPEREVLASLSADPAGPGFLVCLTAVGDEPAPSQFPA